MSKIEVNQISSQCGSTLTVGQSGDTVTLASGASQTGFGRTGTVDWDTTAKTASFTAVSGVGYFVNTTSGAITVTLPAGSAGSIVSLKDYANTWQTNNVTVTPNGTDKINGINDSATLNTEDQSVTLVYVDNTKGWRAVQDSTSTVDGASFITATGGTITCCGDYRIHTFTGPGTFCVSAVGNPAGSNSVCAAIVAGGGGAGSLYGGGGGGGGLVLDSDGFTVSATGYPIVIGSGGAGPTGNCSPGAPGSNSTGLGYVTIGGGHGGGGGGGGGAEAGGSGGGGGGCNGGTVTGTQPSQSNPGATNFGNPGGPGTRGGGGGGAGGAGSSGPVGAGGAGLDVSPTVGPAPLIPNSGVYSAGGGGQAGGTIGAANTGNGGGGDCHSCGRGAGGSGIVIIKYKFQ